MSYAHHFNRNFSYNRQSDISTNRIMNTDLLLKLNFQANLSSRSSLSESFHRVKLLQGFFKKSDIVNSTEVDLNESSVDLAKSARRPLVFLDLFPWI